MNRRLGGTRTAASADASWKRNPRRTWVGAGIRSRSTGPAPLKRFLQKQIETRLARALLAGEVAEHSTVVFRGGEDGLTMDTVDPVEVVD